MIQSADRPKIEYKIAWDVVESLNFSKLHGSYDVTSKFELDFRATG